MKKKVFLLLFVINFCFGQEQIIYRGFDKALHNPEIIILQGSWRINELISNNLIKEYNLYPQSQDRFLNYGNNITLEADQSFVSAYSAKCGNDCFTTTTGKYKIINENYICFFLEEITQHGECGGWIYDFETNQKVMNVKRPQNLDLGPYYFYKTENGNFNLIKSSGNIEQDKKNVIYRNLIVEKDKKLKQLGYKPFGFIKSSNHIFNWKQTNLTDEKEIVAFCMKENQIKKYRILFSHKVDKYNEWNIVLVKVKNEFRYVLYGVRSKLVGLYDDSKI